MANRTLRKPRFPFVQTGMFGRLTTIGRSLVVPGETMKSHKVKFRMQSLPINKPLAGARVDVWSFYVPNRLCWESWVDFLLDGGISIPRTQTAAPRHFEASAFNPNFFGPAYESIVNNYFRTDEDAEYTYAQDLAALPIVDGTADTMGSVDAELADETIDVTGGTLSLKEFELAKARLGHERKMDMLDGKYASYLKMFGVNARETAIELPELLGASSKFIWPSKAIDQSTGYTVQSYFHEVDIEFAKPRYFSEHGFVLTFMAVRPKVVAKKTYPAEFTMLDPENWPAVGQLRENKVIDPVYPIAGDHNDDKRQTYDMLLQRGQFLATDLVASPFSLTVDPNDQAHLRIPTAAWDTLVTDVTTLAGDHFALDGVISERIITPLRLEKAA